jgi:DNA-binding beta-propeller fold protein YncE
MDPSVSRLGHWFVALGFAIASAMSVASAQAQQLCGGVDYPFPYTDVSGVGAAFCPGIMEAYVTGVSKGTSPTTFSPDETVSRVQMTTFLQRSLDQGVTRVSRRAALNQWWVPQDPNWLQIINVGGDPYLCATDGENVWTANGSEVLQIQASTGMALGTWTGAASGFGVLAAAGKVFVAGGGSPGSLYVIDPTQPPGAVSVASSGLGSRPYGMAFDGTSLWTANLGPPGSVSIITPASGVTTITNGFTNPAGILYDGAHIWVSDFGANKLFQLDVNGNILKTVTVGAGPVFPVFDGTNIWVPNSGSNSLTVVQASTGTAVATIAADANNLLSGPSAATFDGERVLVTNTAGNTVSVFKAADLTFIANVATGTASAPFGACSDGINFWVLIEGMSELLRF